MVINIANVQAGLIIFLTFVSTVSFAQNAGSVKQTMDRINLATITIVGGDINSTSARLVYDMGAVLNDGDERRVLPVLGLDAVQTVSDVLHLKGVDLGLVHEDALDAIGDTNAIPNIKNRLEHITRLSHDNIYVIAAISFESINQLAGRTVNFGPGAPSPYTTPALLFQAHDIDVNPVNLDHADAVEDIKNGKIAATVIVGGDLKEIATRLRLDKKLRLLSVDMPINSDKYLPISLTNADFPDIIPAGTSLDTVSVALIMVVNRWPTSHPRHQKVGDFVQDLFSRFDEFKTPTRHPKWHEVNLAAKVVNWNQFRPAKDWLASNQQMREENAAKLEGYFEGFLARNDKINLSREERQALFQDFLTWPKNPIEAEISVRLVAANGIGEKIGTIKLRNTEITVAGRTEPALLITPNLANLEGGGYAFHVHEHPDCGPGEKDGKMTAGLGAGGHLWLAGTGDLEGHTFGSHLGDLPDVIADADGTATNEIIVARLTLADMANRAIMLHANEDDASPRMACGVIR